MAREWIESLWIGQIGGIPLCQIGDPAEDARLCKLDGQFWVDKPKVPGAVTVGRVANHLRSLATQEEIEEGRRVMEADGLTFEYCDAVVEAARSLGQGSEPDAPTGPTVAEARRRIEDAVEALGGAAHERYAGLSRTDRNDMVCAVQSGLDVEQVCISWLADEAGNEAADEVDENCDEENGGEPQSSIYGLLAMFEGANSGKEPVAFVELTTPPDGWRPLARAEGLRRFERYEYEDDATKLWGADDLHLYFPSWDGESEIAYLSKPDGPGCDQ